MVSMPGKTAPGSAFRIAWMSSAVIMPLRLGHGGKTRRPINK
jgi:hypothetical protein